MQLKRELEGTNSQNANKNEVNDFTEHLMVKRVADIIETGVDYKRQVIISVLQANDLKTSKKLANYLDRI